MFKLSNRLLTLAQMVPLGAKVADIGTDHALLPIFLSKEEISSHVIGVDVHKGPYDRACHTVSAYDFKDKIELRLGNGLTVIKPGEVNTVVIAGMGGAVIRDIFEESPRVLSAVKKVILQPMVGCATVRYWLYSRGWLITEEEIVYEDKQYYQVIGAEPSETAEISGTNAHLTELEASYGPLLIKKKHPFLKELVKKDIVGLQDILAELAKSEKKEAHIRFKEYAIRMQKLKELKEWLSAAKPL